MFFVLFLYYSLTVFSHILRDNLRNVSYFFCILSNSFPFSSLAITLTCPFFFNWTDDHLLHLNKFSNSFQDKLKNHIPSDQKNISYFVFILQHITEFQLFLVYGAGLNLQTYLYLLNSFLFSFLLKNSYLYITITRYTAQ